ncbi:MAG TPA: hypothetical protein PK006_12715 [Saprospiraceae bacterium]|nr:hypothetical protein [Saprospiraceae bacterium]
MQKVVFLLLISGLLLTCDKKKTSLVDGFYYSNLLKELMVIKENAKHVEIYSILLNTSYQQDTLKYQCLGCPNGETVIHLQQLDSSNIKVEADFVESTINSRIFRKLENNAFPWDSLKICTGDSCILFYSNVKYKDYLYIMDSEFNLTEELQLVTNPNFLFYQNVTDSEPVEMNIYYKNKDKLIRNTRGLHLYLRNLNFIVNVCLSKEDEKKERWCCELIGKK